MTSIGSLNSSTNLLSLLAARTATATAAADDDAQAAAASGSQGPSAEFEAVMASLASALSEAGIDLPPPPSPPEADAAPSATDAGDDDDVQQALHGFIHSLLDALAAGDGTTGYDSAQTSIDSLLQQVQSEGGDGSALTALTADLGTLVSALQGGTEDALPVDVSAVLESFLTSLSARLSALASSSVAGTGGLVNDAA